MRSPYWGAGARNSQTRASANARGQSSRLRRWLIVVCVLGGAVTADNAAASGGLLTQKPGSAGCITENFFAPCVDGWALNGAESVTVAPDGSSVHVTAPDSDTVQVFGRLSDGTLYLLKPGAGGCISDVGTDRCVDGRALNGPYAVAVSPDGTSAYVASVDSDAVAVFDRGPGGKLTQKAGMDGCISDTGSGDPIGGPCFDGTGLDGADSVAVSPDGTSVYATSAHTGAVLVFDRTIDPDNMQLNGRLTPKTTGQNGQDYCWSYDGHSNACGMLPQLRGTTSVTVSPDNKNVYVTSNRSSDSSGGAVLVFDRSVGGVNGKLTPTGCISQHPTAGCVDGSALGSATWVTVSPDGTSVYVGSFYGVAVLDRDASGNLKHKAAPDGCLSMSGSSSGTPCTVVPTMRNGASSVIVSPDRMSAYVTTGSEFVSGSSELLVFDRTVAGPLNGKLTQKPGQDGCIANNWPLWCLPGTALNGTRAVAVSPDGGSVYVAAGNSRAVAVFDRELPPAGRSAVP